MKTHDLIMKLEGKRKLKGRYVQLIGNSYIQKGQSKYENQSGRMKELLGFY